MSICLLVILGEHERRWQQDASREDEDDVILVTILILLPSLQA
mgnify:CR=1 FL=1